MTKLAQMREEHRFKELKAIYEFIETANPDELGNIIAEIRTVHDHLHVFDADNNTYQKVNQIRVYYDTIQLICSKEKQND